MYMSVESLRFPLIKVLWDSYGFGLLRVQDFDRGDLVFLYFSVGKDSHPRCRTFMS